MKKYLIAGLALALVGSAAAVGGAYSLYKKNAEEISISIGARTSGDVTYTVTNPAWNEGFKAFAPGVSNTLGFALGGTAGAEGIYTQDVLVGKLSVEISSTDADVINYLDSLSLAATVNYAKVGTEHDKDCFWAKEGRNVVSLAKSEGKLVGSKVLPVDMGGSNTVGLPIAFPETMSQEDMLAVAESKFDVKITWEEPSASEFDFAYVCGSMETGSWEKVDEWRMVPMLNTEHFEWKYILDAEHQAYMTEGVKIKGRANEHWSANFVPGDSGLNVDDDGNAVVTAAKAGKVKGIYWRGESTQAISVDATESK